MKYVGEFKNGIWQEIWCPFVPTAIFSFFVIWCNSGLDALQQEGLKWLDLFKLWVAADFLLVFYPFALIWLQLTGLQAPKLQNDIMEIFHRIFTKERLGWPLDDDFNFFSINYVYNNTYPGSQLRRLVCDMVVYSNNICPFYDTRHLFNPEFLSEPQLEHLKWYQDQYGRDAPVAEYPSYYHVSEARLVRGSGEGLQVVRQE